MLVTATLLSGWIIFDWLKNGVTIKPNPNKYSNITEINPNKIKENLIKSTLTIYNVTKEDEGNYTFILYYDPNVLKEYGITDEVVTQTSALVQVINHSKFVINVCLTCMHA